jgi:flavin-dependent dehydrogenase
VGRKLQKVYDLVVVGGGPAGATAALQAARRDAAVLLVEEETGSAAQTSAGWLGPAGVSLCKECGLAAGKVGATEFKGVRLHSWDMKHSTSVEDRQLRGWLVECAAFDRALLDAAAAAGAEGLRGVELRELHLGEDRVRLHLRDGREVAGRVLLIANGVASSTGQMAHLMSAAQQPDIPHCALAEYEVDEDVVRLDVAISASRAGQVATIARLGHLVCLSLVTRVAEVPIEQQFHGFCNNAVECGLLPPGVPDEPVHGLCPSGVALDLDTHVGKRCLLIGGAGGFVAAFSNEEVYPAMRSGWIAAETALRALKAPVLQDELASFGVAWRGALADYLRMPNTDLSLLAPLVFNNEQMSRRVARAFLLGQPF